MINYSIAMKLNPQKRNEPKKAYAYAQCTEKMDINRFSEHIASHGSVYSRADIAAVLTLAVDCMREQLLNGVRIELGDLGDFSISLKSTGAETAELFNPAVNITKVSVSWQPGERFANLMEDAVFNVVPSRKVAQQVLKAIKAGETTVDFNADDAAASGTDDSETAGA